MFDEILQITDYVHTKLIRAPKEIMNSPNAILLMGDSVAPVTVVVLGSNPGFFSSTTDGSVVELGTENVSGSDTSNFTSSAPVSFGDSVVIFGPMFEKSSNEILSLFSSTAKGMMILFC